MYLKRIEIVGFKSFADKVVIDFNDGFTCVIGPNGCGKSNVADAIRWTLGEQSARVLRGRKMIDVVFHGTAMRKPSSHCEVVLIFDNSSRHYNIDATEVRISRKLYRSGDSEYYINNVPRRLKDIIELFRDTGIGKEGYSIIGQGAITDILSVRPDDRRHIFEEAAGITKFRVKRTEAEKKLDRAKANLELAEYRKGNLEKDIEPLREQSEKAKKAKTFKDQLRIQEVNTYLYQSEHNSAKKLSLQNEIGEAETKLSRAQLNRDETQLLYDKTAFDISTADKEKNDLHEQFAQIRISHEQVHSKHSNASVRHEEMTKRKQEYAEELVQKTTASETARRDLVKSKEEKEILLSRYVGLQKNEETLSAEVDELNIKQRDKTREIDEINRLILSSSDQKGIIGAEQASLKVKIENLSESLAKDKEIRDELKAGMAAAKKELDVGNAKAEEMNAELNKKMEQKKQVERSHFDMLSERDKSEDLLERLNGDINRLVGEIKLTENMIRTNSQYSDGVRNLLNSNDSEVKSRIVSLVGTAVTIPSQLSVAMEIALGRSAQHIITEDEDDTEYLINYLKKKGGGRVTCLAISKIMPRDLRGEFRGVLEEDGCLGLASDLIRYDRKYRNIMSFLLGSVVIVEDMAAARRLSNKYRNAFRIITLSGEDFAPGGATTGGSAPSGDGGLLMRENTLKEKKKQLEASEGRRNVLKEEIRKLTEEIDKLTRISNLLQMECQKLDKEYGLLLERNRTINVDVIKHTESIARLDKEISEKQKELKTEELRYSVIASNVDQAESSKMNANELLEHSRKEFAEGEIYRNTKVKELSELTLEVNTVKNTIDNLSMNINKLEAEMKQLTADIMELKSKAATNDIQLAQAERDLMNSQLSDEAREELEQVKKLMEESDAKKELLKEKQSELQKLIAEYTQDIADCTVAKTLAENKLIGLDSASYELALKIREEYELDDEAALEYKLDDYDVKQGEIEIKKLKKEISRLGDVNEMAIEQYESKSGEYNKLLSDYNDVVGTIAEIQKTVDELTAVMEDNFSECFAKINENFKQIFAEIFDGGKGYLELDMGHGESVLDAGIEIFAEPGGKKIQHISLLSGGERALTAIAILFSIIKLKPMPFCVLDEIEAALDDANAYLFAKFLRKYCNLTQFLVISHRKPTMELADTLFGITMEEKGVSQFFSANMKDVDKILEEKAI